ncbi:hypothetical protein ACFW2V_13960 [Streptomyces sp. NPDC058947]|uniref:hypothetical protein n=1 Tax=Streptomyces sp. NPDC058947 TaxID=3346675 RepID=UPI00367756AC
MAQYRVALHGHASVEVFVEAPSVQEANRKALKMAPTVKGVKSWTPVMTGLAKKGSDDAAEG